MCGCGLDVWMYISEFVNACVCVNVFVKVYSILRVKICIILVFIYNDFASNQQDWTQVPLEILWIKTLQPTHLGLNLSVLLSSLICLYVLKRFHRTKLSSPQKHHSKSFEEANSILKREIKPNLKNFCSRKVTTPVKWKMNKKLIQALISQKKLPEKFVVFWMLQASLHQLKKKKLMKWMINLLWWRDLDDRWALIIERRKLKTEKWTHLAIM